MIFFPVNSNRMRRPSDKTPAHRNTRRFIVAILMLVQFFVTGIVAADDNLPPPGECPQPRFTDKAPENYLLLSNPLEHNKKNIKTGRKIYQSSAKPIPCSRCHGPKGDGKGIMANQFEPPPRNFACAETVNGIPDGQLFWIIQNGSPGTSMPDFKYLSDEQIWQLIQYLRVLAND